ncbi:MAG: hypothetical protein LBS64_01485 [Spirochaetaceae bacterium]|jgi:hypothetical protein|nr:hypothetical protein [Spirochaetaceae bacterium]
MKNRLEKVFFLVVMLVSSNLAVHAQVVTVASAPLMEAIMTETKLEQVIFFAQSIAQQVENVTNTYNQFQNLIRTEKRALDNLKGAQNITNWADFMSWYNRQLYLEKQAESRFNSLGVKIGGKKYKIADIQDIPNALQTEYVDYWDNDFSEAQRKKMWKELGLAPSNYVYIKAWQAREEELAKNILTKREVQNDENMAAAERQKEVLDQLAEDKDKPEDEKMGEKEIAQLNLETGIDTNRAIRSMAYDLAEARERELAAERAAAVPPAPPRLSDSWDNDPFAYTSAASIEYEKGRP